MNADPLYDRAVTVVLDAGKASPSLVQRKLGIGWEYASWLIEAMERNGIVGRRDSAGRRAILAPKPSAGS